MCRWQKCPDAEAAEGEAERATAKLESLRTAIEDHRRGVLDDDAPYAVVDDLRLRELVGARWS